MNQTFKECFTKGALLGSTVYIEKTTNVISRKPNGQGIKHLTKHQIQILQRVLFLREYKPQFPRSPEPATMRNPPLPSETEYAKE
jgi:hypothetical protein